MIRVMHVVRPATGGIRQHVIEVVTRADHERFSQSMAAPAAFLTDLPPDLPLAARAAVEIAPTVSPGRDLLAATRLAQFAAGRADLIHAHGLRAAFVAALACRLRPLPLVFTAHNLIPQGRMTRFGLGWVRRYARRGIAVSHAVALGLQRAGFDSDRITIISNGIDLDHFAVASAARPRSSETFTIGCVARLSPEKGVDILLRAAARLPEVAVVIAGDGPESLALRKIAPANVHFLGRVNDTRDMYRAVDVVVVPSRQEGQGIVALEAMASGVPVVASNVGGLGEMLTDGETALLVRPEDAEALAEAIHRLEHDTDLRVRLAANGQRLARERYDVRTMVASIEDVY